MTAVREPETDIATGRVVRVTGPVVDAEFSRDNMPELFNALHVTVEGEGESAESVPSRELTLEVAQHVGDNVVRAISMQPTDGLVRGADVTDTGGPITVPVGDQVKGHVFNALGACLDDPDFRRTGDSWPIHRD